MLVYARRDPRRLFGGTTPPPLGETTGGPVGEDEALAKQDKRLGYIERQLDRLARRMEAIEKVVKSDAAAPMPSVYDDGEGER